MLDSDVENKELDSSVQSANGSRTSDGQSQVTADEDNMQTPTISPEASRPLDATHKQKLSPEAITSSLLNSLTLIIDIIRKNNSDFTELQILQYLERANGNFDPDGIDEGADMAGEGEEEIGRLGVMDQGPSLVDLEPMLRELTARLPDLHKLLQNPRSNVCAVNISAEGETC